MSDIQLIWDNCKTYNEPDSVFQIKCIGNLSFSRIYGAID